MKKLLASVILFFVIAQAWAVDTYNPTNGQLTIPTVVVGTNVYTNVVIQVGNILSVGSSPANGAIDSYNASNGQLTIPSVLVGALIYYNVTVTVGGVLSIGNNGSIPVNQKSLTPPNASYIYQGVNWQDYGYQLYGNSTARSQMLSYIKSINANTITLNNNYQVDPMTGHVTASYFDSNKRVTGFLDEKYLIDVANYFNQNGINIVYKLFFTNFGNNLFAENLQNPTQFMKEYAPYVLNEAKIAQKMNAKIFVIGTELGVITSLYPTEWANLISNIKQVYSGGVTYASNFNIGPPGEVTPGIYNSSLEAPTLSFGNLLDFIGLDEYCGPPWDPILGTPVAGVPTKEKDLSAYDDVKNTGYSIIDQIRKISNQYNKPIFITESGFSSQPFNGWNYANPPVASNQNQYNLTQAQHQIFKTYLGDIIVGLAGNAEFPEIAYKNNAYLLNNRPFDFSIMSKPAQEIMTSYFTGTALSQNYSINLSSTTPIGFGYGGDDTFTAVTGAHVIDGGEGKNTVVYQLNKSNFTVTKQSNGSFLVTSKSNTVGPDTLINIQVLQFADSTMNLN